MSKSLALFDFDGTLTKRDTLLDFIIYTSGLPRTILGAIILSPFLISYKLGLYNNSKAKEKVISYFFKGWAAEEFSVAGANYATKRLPKTLKSSAKEKIKYHLDSGHEVAVVSASIEDWIIEWTNELDIKLIATQLEKKEGIVTGEFETKNCYGPEKVKRIKEKFNIEEYDCIYAYGDTEGDQPMLELADKAYYKPF
ncbi:MAG: HAD-IB family hydrolase [Bacteroidota bacterium]